MYVHCIKLASDLRDSLIKPVCSEGGSFHNYEASTVIKMYKKQ